MKTFIKMLMALGLVAGLTACGGGGDTATVTPTCSITQGALVTETNITADVVCVNLPTINQATVTADGVLKDLNASGQTSINQTVHFGNLISNTTYTVVLDVIAGGQTFTKDVNITTISTPTITMADQTVNDNGGGGGVLATDLPAPTVTGVNAGAVYSITTGTTGLSINSSTGVMTYDNDLFADTTFSITIKVTNTDGGNSSTTFSLTVIDNG